jgi:hypothetical protein
MNEPQRLAGGKAIHEWLNRLLAFCKSHKALESPDFRLEQTANGFRYRKKEEGGGSPEDNLKRTWVIRVNGVLRDVKINSDLPTEHAE